MEHCRSGACRQGRFYQGSLNESGYACVSVHSKKEAVVTGQDKGKIRIINWISEEVVYENLEPKIKAVSAIQFSSDGRYMVAVYKSGTFKRWRADTWEIVEVENMPFRVSRVSTRVAGKTVMLDNQGVTWVKDLGTLDMTEVAYLGLSSSVIDLGLRRNGDELIVGSGDRAFRIRKCNVAEKRGYNTETIDNVGVVRGIALSANGKYVIICHGGAGHALFMGYSNRTGSRFLP